MMRLIGLGMALTLFATGCNSVYEGYDEYRPRPAEVVIPGESRQAGALVRTLASIVGVREEAENRPPALEVALRVHNDSGSPVTFLPESLELVSGDLNPLPNPMVEPDQPIEIAPNNSARIAAYFPLTESVREMDLDGLYLRWQLDLGEGIVTQSVNFIRREDENRYHHDPSYGVGLGVGIGGVYD